MKKILMTLAAALLLFNVSYGQTEKTMKNLDNETIQTIMARRSIRAFKSQPVDREVMDAILKCAINAPSARNSQSWEVRVTDDPEFIEGLNDAVKENAAKSGDERMAKMVSNPKWSGLFYGAPTVVFVADTEDRWSESDCGMFCENLMLAAQSLGVGSVALGSPAMMLSAPGMEDYLAKLEIPSDHHIYLVIALGYPDQSPDAKPRDAGKVKWVKQASN
jgi:nitroreductase